MANNFLKYLCHFWLTLLKFVAVFKAQAKSITLQMHQHFLTLKNRLNVAELFRDAFIVVGMIWYHAGEIVFAPATDPHLAKGCINTCYRGHFNATIHLFNDPSLAEHKRV